MMRQRLLSAIWLAVAAAGAALATSWATTPRQFVVVGRSMLPGLADGDLVEASGWPAAWQTPQRHERWLVRMPDETRVIKRIAGLPGEQLAIDAGNLVIDGKRLLPSPEHLAQTAARVSGGRWSSSIRDGIRWQAYQHLVVDRSKANDDPHRLVPGPIYDSLEADPTESRRLEPVFAAGIAAVLDHRRRENEPPAEVFIRVGPQAARLTLPHPGRFAAIAGRLAERFVVAAWPIPPAAHSGSAPSSPIPGPPPASWSLIAGAKPLPTRTQAPPLAIGVPASTSVEGQRVTLHSATIWRALHLLPAANGSHRWSVPLGHVFLLGDNPAASRDSRHFGPVATSHLLGPVHTHTINGH
ncbi:MAG: S26 family signal peptidase [Planctomycetota bacterium]|nr:S26 family signal peptidase [Planctomycetota bacterium]